jgi:ParB family chromosome partitioning protein
MTLDGRRRQLGLLQLRDRGELTDDYEVDRLLAETKPQQGAAVMLRASEHAPVHIADVIVAIGKLRRSKMDIAAIAAALGHAELETKRLEALAAVHANVLKALRQGRLTLKQVRLLARLADKTQQAEIAKSALDGHFQNDPLRRVVEGGSSSVADDCFTLVDMDRYIAAGGRVSSDLFGEPADRLFDAEILQTVWRPRVQPIVDRLESEGLSAFVAGEAGFGARDGFDRLAPVWERLLSENQA